MNRIIGKGGISKRSVFPIVLPLVLNLLSARGMRAQGPEVNGTPSSLASVADELYPKFGPVRFHREEQFEDRFIVEGAPVSVFALQPKIYQVQEKRFDASSGSVKEEVPNGLPTMYIATSRDGLKAYRLTGFHSPEQTFNRLVNEGPDQKIRTKREAESRGLLCAEIVYGLSPNWWLEGASSVKSKAAEHFFAEGHKDGLLLGQRWWNSVKGDRDAIQITSTNAIGGFSVSLPVFWAPVEGPANPVVKLYHIDVTEDGRCFMKTQPSVLLR